MNYTKNIFSHGVRKALVITVALSVIFTFSGFNQFANARGMDKSTSSPKSISSPKSTSNPVHTGGAHKSGKTIQQEVDVHVTVVGNQFGTVRSYPSWNMIRCGASGELCDATYKTGDRVELYAYRSVPNVFLGWSNSGTSCDGSLDIDCVFTISGSGPINITATFGTAPAQPILTIVKHSIGGDGTFVFDMTGTSEDHAQITTVNGYGTTTADIIEENGTVSEEEQPGWALNQISCVVGNDNVGTDSISRGKALALAQGENVTCTFTNISTS